MDAIGLLTKDHEAVRQLFKQFEAAGEGAGKAKRKILDKIIRELSVHSQIEETLFYPTVRQTAQVVQLQDASDEVLEALEEHHIVKWLLSELETMDPEAERFEAKVKVLKENVLHHAEEEEQKLFPMVRKLLAAEELGALGEVLENAKLIVPTRPHPRAPDQPPGNLVAGVVATVVDKGRDAFRELAGRVRRGQRGKRQEGEPLH